MRKNSKRNALITIFLAALVVSGCSETVEEEKLFNGEEYVSGNYPAEGEGPEITVDSARYVEEIDGYPLIEKEKALEIELTAKNDTDVKIDIDTLNFYIRDVEGMGNSFYYLSDDISFNGSILPGKEITVKFYFDVLEKDSYELVYRSLGPESEDTFLVTLTK